VSHQYETGGGVLAAAPEGATTAPPAREGAVRSARVRELLTNGSLAVPAALVAMIVLFSALRPDTFGTMANLQSTVTTQAVLVALVSGLTIVCAVGEFDLSCAAVIGLSASIVAHLSTSGTSVAVAVTIAMAASLAVGVVNALLVVGIGVNSFITTLGMGTIVTGVALGAIGPTTIGGLPESLQLFGQSLLLGVGVPFYLALGLVAVLWYLTQRTPTGRHILFVGEGREAAWLVGVRVNRIRAGAFVLSGAVAGLAGLLLASQTGAASPTYGSPFLLPAYAAVFLGATVQRGRFSIVGSFLAVYLLAVGTTGLQMLGSPEWVTQVFSGAVLVVAVSLATLTSRRR
jgi:ribose transport system permease protein